MTQISDLGELLALRAQLSADSTLSQDDVKAVLGEAVEQFLTTYRTAPFTRIANAARIPLRGIDDVRNEMARLRPVAHHAQAQITQAARSRKPAASAAKSKA